MTVLADLPTPALVVVAEAFEFNVATMARARPGSRLRPHVKAHKCTTLARYQAEIGHSSFTCATPREVIGMAAAGLGADLLLANETLDQQRLAAMAALDNALVTVAVDSLATIEAAARAGIRHVVIDVNVGLPRCGCRPDDAARLAERCRDLGLVIRGVMGYEGHLMAMADRADQASKVTAAMHTLVDTFDAVRDIGGHPCTIISAGGTGTFDLYDTADDVLSRINEVQAGSYALMDTQYGSQGLPFRQALHVVGSVISQGESWFVADVGLKALGMDHGNPSIPGATVWFCSDEHITYSPESTTEESHGTPKRSTSFELGGRVTVLPAHVDPTVAQHDRIHLVDGLDPDARVLEIWPVDLRGW